MKNILKIATLFLVFTAFWSCTNDKDPVAGGTAFELRKDALVTPPTVFSEANKSDTFAILNWDRSTYGVSSVPKYYVVISDQANPANEVVLPDLVIDTEADSRTSTLSVDDLNTAMNQLPSFNCNQMNIDIKIKSILGISSNSIPQYSNPISVAVTGYPKTPLTLAFVKDSDDPNAALKLASSSFLTNSDYEGYMYLEPGNYKFYQPDACGDYTTPTVYGLTAGSLVAGGSDSFNVAVAGHYLVKANLSSTATNGVPALSYAISSFTSFGIFGTAKGVPFATNRPMTYNSTTKKWELTFELFKGRKFRFKSLNGSTTVSLLGAGSTSGLLNHYPLTDLTTSAGDIRVPGTDDGSKQNYVITLDTNTPRSYSYELVAN